MPGSATLNGSIISSDNGRYGINLSLVATVFVGVGARVTASDNVDTGILINAHSVFSLGSEGGTLITEDNGGRGIVAQENSSLNVYGGTVTIRRNAAGGLQALRNAFVRLQSAGSVALVAQINNNGGNGVDVNQDASVRFDQGTTIQNNAARGMWFLGGSHGNLTHIVVRNNGDDGIEAHDTSLQLTDIYVYRECRRR